MNVEGKKRTDNKCVNWSCILSFLGINERATHANNTRYPVAYLTSTNKKKKGLLKHENHYNEYKIKCLLFTFSQLFKCYEV